MSSENAAATDNPGSVPPTSSPGKPFGVFKGGDKSGPLFGSVVKPPDAPATPTPEPPTPEM